MITDIHQHLVYGVDDGAADFETSVSMLNDSVKQGVKEIVCTRHVSSRINAENDERYKRCFDRLSEYALQKKLDVKLFEGAEILYCDSTQDMLKNGLIPGLNNTGFVLTEFFPETPFTMIRRALLDICCAGATPVLAHVERYYALWENPEYIRKLKWECDVLIQLNADTVVKGFSGWLPDFALRRAIKNGLIDIVASDAHNLNGRRSRMGAAMEIIQKKFGAEKARELFYDTPHSIITDED